VADVRDNPAENRYEVVVDGAVAGFARYALRKGRVILVHTEVDDAYEGQGLGSQLAKGALDDVRRRGLAVVPLCPFIADYIERHAEYQDLVDTELMARLDTD
jgi:uncharacterized protein